MRAMSAAGIQCRMDVTRKRLYRETGSARETRDPVTPAVTLVSHSEETLCKRSAHWRKTVVQRHIGHPTTGIGGVLGGFLPRRICPASTAQKRQLETRCVCAHGRVATFPIRDRLPGGKAVKQTSLRTPLTVCLGLSTYWTADSRIFRRPSRYLCAASTRCCRASACLLRDPGRPLRYELVMLCSDTRAVRTDRGGGARPLWRMTPVLLLYIRQYGTGARGAGHCSQQR